MVFTRKIKKIETKMEKKGYVTQKYTYLSIYQERKNNKKSLLCICKTPGKKAIKIQDGRHYYVN